ncbi:hypothetical protein QOT17_005002 [Balamuthia mandrillaris]
MKEEAIRCMPQRMRRQLGPHLHHFLNDLHAVGMGLRCSFLVEHVYPSQEDLCLFLNSLGNTELAALLPHPQRVTLQQKEDISLSLLAQDLLGLLTSSSTSSSSSVGCRIALFVGRAGGDGEKAENDGKFQVRKERLRATLWPPTLIGYLLRFPVLYCSFSPSSSSTTTEGEQGNCLAMVPLRVFQVVLLPAERKHRRRTGRTKEGGHLLMSFSIPESILAEGGEEDKSEVLKARALSRVEQRLKELATEEKLWWHAVTMRQEKGVQLPSVLL